MILNLNILIKMETPSYKMSKNNLTYNNIEKIKKSIDCLKETIKRSNSHLYFKGSINIRINNNEEKIEEGIPIVFPYTQRVTYEKYKTNTHNNLNKSANIHKKKRIGSFSKKLNNISFYNINITNGNNKKNFEPIRNVYDPELSYRNKYNKSINFNNLTNKSPINKKVSNTSNNQINKEKIEKSINELENINKELKDKYKNNIQKYKSSVNQNKLILKKISDMKITLNKIKDINSKIKMKFDNMNKTTKNNEFIKNKDDLIEKNKQLKMQIEQKDKKIFYFKNKINNIINSDNNNFNNIKDINKVSNIIEELKNKINKINNDISKQEEIMKFL